MEEESIFGMMVDTTKENILMIKNKDMGFMYGLMEEVNILK